MDKKQNFLVVVANSNECKLYNYIQRPATLNLTEQLSHSASKLRNQELTSDREGHYMGWGDARGAYSPHTEAKDEEIIIFVREIAHHLNKLRINHQLDPLIIVAPAPIYGKLCDHLDKNVQLQMVADIQKDLLKLNDNELLKYLTDHLPYALDI